MKKTLEDQLLQNFASNLTNLWEDWNKVNHHDKTNGLSQKAVNAYRHEHPGSHLQTAVTTKPSKLKAGSKAAKRRKSFCARMSGNKGPMKKPNGKPTPKALALRRWNCESIEEMRQLIEYAEQEIAREKMLAEAHDPKFAGFMNQALGTRQDKKPLRVDPKTVMSMNNMPGYKHAFKFGMDIIKKMDPDTKEHFANEDDDALESYMIDIAEKKGFIPKYFVEEDLSEVVGEFEEIFHDPEMEGWSWADLLRDMIGQEPRAHEKANVQAHKQMMAKAQAEKDNLPPIDPNKLQVVDRTDTGKSEIWYPSGGFFGTDSWAVVQDGFKDKAHAEHALKQLKANPNVVNIIKKAIEDENMSESTGDKPFDTMMKSIKKGTKKQATADRREQKRQDQERTRDAIANMFGGGNPADKLSIRKKDVAEGVPQPGESSGAPKQFGPDAKIQTRQMTVKQIISSIPGLPYYNNVVDDWDAKDYSWGVTKKVIEYATYLKEHPKSLSQLPPILVLNGKFEDGAHRVSAIWLLQQRMDPKNPLWKNAKLNVQFVKQGVAEGLDGRASATPAINKRGKFTSWDENEPMRLKCQDGEFRTIQEINVLRQKMGMKPFSIKGEQGVAEGAQQAAIAIAKRESGKYTKDGKRKK